MKAPRQWLNPWLKEDPKRFDIVDCVYACYHSLRQKVETDNLFKFKSKIQENASSVD